jgi:pyruvate formate lyase activating enzyme
MRFMGKEMSVDEVFAVIMRDADYYRDSGGGVTLSGGEVLSQAEFALELLQRCREAGIHTCVDTSGQGDTAKLATLLPFTDLFYFDLKHLDPDVHREVTGYTNELVIRNFEEVVASGVPVVVRVPVIPGVNDTTEDIAAIAAKVSALTGVATVHLLPYHRFGSNKYAMLDLEYELGAVEAPAAEFLEAAREVVQSYGLACQIAE